MKYVRALLLATVASLVCATIGGAADYVLAGAVSSASGQVLEGATVSAKRQGSTITTVVHTDAGGSYYFPPLPAGIYRVSAQALGFEMAAVVLDANVRRDHDFTLPPMTDPERRYRQLPGELMVAALPADTQADALSKKVIMNYCAGCHAPGFALQFRFDEAGWSKIIDLMKVGGRVPGYEGPIGQILGHHQKELARYLARARGPGETSMTVTPPSRPTGEAARVVWRLYDLPLNPDAGLGTTDNPMDSLDWALGHSPKLGAALAHDSEMGPDGNLYFTVNNTHRLATIGRVDTRTGEVSYVKSPAVNGMAAPSHGMARDAQGNFWFDVNPGPRHSLGKLDVASQKISVYEPPPELSAVGLEGTTVDVDGKGMVWVTAADGVLRFNPATQMFTGFKSRTPVKTASGTGVTYGVAGDRDGNGWWAQMAFDIVGRADAGTGEVSEMTLPPMTSELGRATPGDRAFWDNFNQLSIGTPFPWSQGPRRMGADKGADVLWVGNAWGSNLARIDTKTGRFTLIPMPRAELQPYHIAVDSAHNAWGDLWTSDQIFRLDPATNTFTMFDIPVHGTEARHISVTERDGKLHVVIPITRSHKLGVMTLRTEAELAALKARR